ncbi:MAG: ABC transporter substrate-binding protein [Spirochaetota bacterium]
MGKKVFVIILAAALTVCTSLAFAGGKPEKNVIGIAKIVSHPALDAVEQGIQDQLNEMGYNFEYDLQNANGELSTAASIANKFKSENVRIAVGIATPTSQALANAFKGTDTVVIYTAVTDPVSAGLVKSLDKGEQNITGVSDMTPVKEQIELLNKITPIQKLGHVYCSSEANARTLADMAKEACKQMGIKFVEATVTNSAEVKQATQTIIDKVDGLYVSTDNTVVSALSALTEVSMKNDVPVMSADPSSAEKFDVLAAWGFDYYKMGRATGKLIAEIIEGKAPENIPTRFMTDPSDVELLINLDVAEDLGLDIPQSVMENASTVIEDGELKKL